MENSLNNGHVIDVTPDMFEQAARDFSEGNETLRQLLMHCFENNIETIGCCSGHDGQKMPYLGFKFNDKNMQAIIKMLANVSVNDVINTISIRKQPGLMASFGVFMKPHISDQEATKGFGKILEALQDERELSIEDLGEKKELMLKAAQNHDIPLSYFEIQQEEHMTSLMISDLYLDAVKGTPTGRVQPWIDDSYKITYPNDSIALATTLRELEPMTKSISEKSYEKYYEKSENNQEPSLGEVADELIELNKIGKQCIREYKGFEIDSSKYESSKDIIKAYEADVYQKRIDELARQEKVAKEGRKEERVASAAAAAGNIEPKEKNREALDNYLKNPDNNRAIKADASATFERKMETGEDVFVLEPQLGATLETVVQKMMEIKGYGQETILKFNNFEIDTRNYENAEEVIAAYDKNWNERNAVGIGFVSEDIKETIGDVKNSEINATAAEMKKLEIGEQEPKKAETPQVTETPKVAPNKSSSEEPER